MLIIIGKVLLDKSLLVFHSFVEKFTDNQKHQSVSLVNSFSAVPHLLICSNGLRWLRAMTILLNLLALYMLFTTLFLNISQYFMHVNESILNFTGQDRDGGKICWSNRFIFIRCQGELIFPLIFIPRMVGQQYLLWKYCFKISVFTIQLSTFR